jgi:hypothetical protein
VDWNIVRTIRTTAIKMSHRHPDPVPIAVRVYPDPKVARKKSKSKRARRWNRPDAMLVFDTETTTDATQKLLFGCYRFIVEGECLEEGLFHADDIEEKQLSVLRRYVSNNPADTSPNGKPGLLLLTRKEFLKKFCQTIYKGRSLLVGFNLPFDLSRLGFDVVPARRVFSGGFSIALWSYLDKKTGQELADPNRPRITIKHIDSKRALMSFTGRLEADKEDLIPEGSEDGRAEKGYKFRGHFLDLRTLAFALTDRGHTLKSACEAFGVEHGKSEVSEHGKLTDEYIDYNRRDVLATAELAHKLFEEYDKHPIDLQETKALSPASIGKSYLRSMGITPIKERHSNFQPHSGHAQTAYFGGRTSAHIRKVPIPVVYTDFLSMYPTVNRLLHLQDFVVARNIKVVDHCQDEVVGFLRSVSRNFLFQQSTWSRPCMRGFARVIPNGDILPVRGRFSAETNDWQVSVNHLYTQSGDAMWFSVPDIVTSVLLTGRIPEIIDAFRLEPCSQLKGLRPTNLRGAVEIDPRTQDIFRMVIEERKRTGKRNDLPEIEKERLGGALKVFANSTSYGIYGQMDRQETEQKILVRCYGRDEKPYTCRVANPEIPAEYCFPPVASLITGAARLMLGLLESCVTELGGTYAMEDTDSMAIVATKHGGLVKCPGGPHRLPDGSEAVKSLSWKDTESVSKRFEQLRPYDPSAITGSILKIEDDNFDSNTKKQRQLWCYAISAKRYALFIRDRNGTPELLRKNINSKDNHWSEHGLGHLVNPSDPETEDSDWIAQVWLNLIRNSLGLSKNKLKFENTPAIGRITVSSPAVMRPLEFLNSGKQYSEQIKPFNFLLSCHVRPFGYPADADPARFHLIAPYETDSRKWPTMKWINQYSGESYFINASGNYSSRHTARVKTYGDVISDYEFHPEAKCADSKGETCGKQTEGLLQRRHISIGEIIPIGKESNCLEEVEEGLVHSAENVYTVYSDPRTDSWERTIRPLLKKISNSVLQKETGLKRRTLQYARNGPGRPHPHNQGLIVAGLRRLGLISG